jgi:hypothetical protein
VGGVGGERDLDAGRSVEEIGRRVWRGTSRVVFRLKASAGALQALAGIVDYSVVSGRMAAPIPGGAIGSAADC